MKYYEFTLVAKGIEEYQDPIVEIGDDLIDAGVDDCIVVMRNNAVLLDFDRESISYMEATLSAIKQIEKITKLVVISIDAGQYIGLSDAAELSDMTRSALSKYSTGRRGDGTFPCPYLRVSGKTPLYDWAEVSEWLSSKRIIENELAQNARITSKINTSLKIRNRNELEEIKSITNQLLAS
ncbi:MULTISPECIES: AlpA family transcriptional regulator [Vibrio]|uniref:helix-turn-helix transcriptional regulator n=1 Tax=Vibrio TaxID=662 RepID=UPI001267A7EF|nr:MULTISPECIES: DNA-binding protein [Vibrio]QFT39854.1 hypothetical protein FIU99_26055 [Vibrio sp. THAF64]QGM37639.1 hypothetical protein GGC04_25425 [Vibrio sp. THAF191d]QGN73362.1 hypothetical protein GGC03_26600 [Vibrio sp. THAF191c]WFB51115.1 hypothetical protein P6988_26585 [Vibrio coralliilyticus]